MAQQQVKPHVAQPDDLSLISRSNKRSEQISKSCPMPSIFVPYYVYNNKCYNINIIIITTITTIIISITTIITISSRHRH